jgi:hypothetical protein
VSLVTLTIRHSRSLVLSALCLGAACSRGERATTSRPADGADRADATPSTPWTVTPFGIGPLRAGMTRAQAESALGAGAFANTDTAWSGCEYVAVAGLPPGVAVMVEQGTIARIDVRSGSTATAAGARIGDSEQRILDLYHGRATVSPHKYTSGHYLTVTPASASDSVYRIVFETDGRTATEYRAGRLPPVEYVEGCA